MGRRDKKRWKIESVESSLGYLDASPEIDASPLDAKSALARALALSAEVVDDADAVAASCIKHVVDSDPSVRAAAVTALGKLSRRLSRLQAEAIAALKGALSDENAEVRHAAEDAALMVYKSTGITI